MSTPSLAGRILDRLLGVQGRAFARDTYYTDSFDELCKQVEDAVRAGWSADHGFDVRAHRYRNTLFIYAYRGWTAGFVVGLIAQDEPGGGHKVMACVSRSSKVERGVVHVTTACVLAVLIATPLTFGAMGWLLPGIVIAAITFAACVVTGVIVIRVLNLIVAAAEYTGAQTLAPEELAVVAERVRAVAMPPTTDERRSATPLGQRS